MNKKVSKTSIAIITARGGSKRIPRKNIKVFCGQPIIKYSIDAAKQAGCFEEIMVSTDDQEIANITKSYGASIPFLRSKKTSDDFATTEDVVKEVIFEYENIGRNFDFICCIYPTAPFLTSERLNQAYNLLIESGADGVLPVVQFSYPIQRSLKIESNRVKTLWPENHTVRSQDLMPVYYDAGQFYFTKTSLFLNQSILSSENIVPIILSEYEVQDIDNEKDWKIAEMKYSLLKNI